MIQAADDAHGMLILPNDERTISVFVHADYHKYLSFAEICCIVMLNDV